MCYCSSAGSEIVACFVVSWITGDNLTLPVEDVLYVYSCHHNLISFFVVQIVRMLWIQSNPKDLVSLVFLIASLNLTQEFLVCNRSLFHICKWLNSVGKCSLYFPFFGSIILIEFSVMTCLLYFYRYSPLNLLRHHSTLIISSWTLAWKIGLSIFVLILYGPIDCSLEKSCPIVYINFLVYDG